ncbi:MAG: DNA cytosine methyltransferase [Dehalococcoidia bacterium]
MSVPSAAAESTSPAPGLTSLELFTGAGGLALGTHLARFRHAALLEWNADACETLRINVRARSVPNIEDWRVVEGDARSVAFSDYGSVELIAGGPPCQPFSIGGKHRGVEDSRNMIPEFIRAVRELQPRAFILENVRGLLRQNFRTYFSYILLQLTHPTVLRCSGEDWTDHLKRLEDIHTRGADVDLRYNVIFRLLNAADYGVPQTRERVFLVGSRSDLGIEWHFPEPTHSLDALLYQQWATGEYWDSRGLPRPTARPAGYPFDTRRIRFPTSDLKPWCTVRDVLSDLPEPRPDCEADQIANHRLIPGARPYVGHTGSALDLPAKTLKAGDHGVPGGENMLTYPDGSVRYFTAREAARLQTFPDSWRITGSWSEAMRQLGNAVPVNLARVVGASVAAALETGDGPGPGCNSARAPASPAMGAKALSALRLA